jgi:hypothetical protein
MPGKNHYGVFFGEFILGKEENVGYGEQRPSGSCSLDGYNLKKV